MGGLSLKSTRAMNKACLMKAGCRLNTRKKVRWVEVVRSMYKCGREGRMKVDKDKMGSNFGRGVCKSWDLIENNMTWRVGHGQQIRF